ncbi:hypothetical protein LEL_05724 [Akanthomyces lecanii RCEF 1005]|uniref:Uncharacterized protein n=1 Tax=Akanthomyces lecanii RCEF 1005 TaxID=1081108 RepID=A0A168G597_CORDF|nr:hypothetical protein LEL_05724 [Akanthomyces lecanii RCEF 1005]
MPCSAPGVSPVNLTETDKLQYAAIERAQLEKLTQIVDALGKIEVPTIRKDALSGLSIALGAQLNVDESLSSLSDFSETFFGPCDWPLEVLQPPGTGSMELLLVAAVTSQSPDIALTLRSSPGSIRSAIGLRVPFRYFHPRPWRAAPYHQYYAQWVMFAHAASEVPHAACLVLDSGAPDNGAIQLCEAEAAAALVKFQLEDGSYTDHHTKPACFDGKQNMLVMRQSRTLDLSGAAPSPDAWTLLRWIASQPVGETRYATGDAKEGTCGDDPANLAPRIAV